MMILSLGIRPETGAGADSCFDPKQRPVDLTHLARYTMGNSAIEQEVLDLFRRQTRLYFEKLSQATTADSWRDAARVLMASAQSVGAWQMLRSADAAERLSFTSPLPVRLEALRLLKGQIEDANQFIDSIM
jgi:hypothetical protein